MRTFILAMAMTIALAGSANALFWDEIRSTGREVVRDAREAWNIARDRGFRAQCYGKWDSDNQVSFDHCDKKKK
jgi:hypothetical protein